MSGWAVCRVIGRGDVEEQAMDRFGSRGRLLSSFLEIPYGLPAFAESPQLVGQEAQRQCPSRPSSWSSVQRRSYRLI